MCNPISSLFNNVLITIRKRQMKSDENKDYVLILEDHTVVKNERDPGRLSVISGQDEKGNASST